MNTWFPTYINLFHILVRYTLCEYMICDVHCIKTNYASNIASNIHMLYRYTLCDYMGCEVHRIEADYANNIRLFHRWNRKNGIMWKRFQHQTRPRCKHYSYVLPIHTMWIHDFRCSVPLIKTGDGGDIALYSIDHINR